MTQHHTIQNFQTLNISQTIRIKETNINIKNMTDQEFSKKVSNRPLTRMYNYCCSNEVKKLIRENGWKKGTQKRMKIIEELYEELKPAFIDFAHSGPDINDTDNLPIIFSNHLMVYRRRQKIEKIRKRI